MDKEIRPVEIKDLNKTQLILLAILLSFVVSIATGITTVTLMQRASPAVNQTINRVVQQTIEKVVPDYSPTKVQTVVVKEDDLVVDAIAKTRATLANVFSGKDATESLASAYSLGGGTFLVSATELEKGKAYVLKEGDTLYEATVTASSPLGFALISIIKPDDAAKKFPASSLGKDVTIKPGQTLAIVGGTAIAKGTVEGLVLKEQKDDLGKVIASWNVVTTNLSLTSDMIGALAVNLDGDVIGTVVPKGDSGAQIVGVDSISKFVSDSAKPSPSPASGN